MLLQNNKIVIKDIHNYIKNKILKHEQLIS